MRIRFTIRRLLLTMLAIAPIIATIGADIRRTERKERLSREFRQACSEFADLLEKSLPRRLDNFKIASSEISESGSFTTVATSKYTDGGGHNLGVELRGVTHAAFSEQPYRGYRHRSSRVETLDIPDVGKVNVRCTDLYAETLNRTLQRVVVYGHKGQWTANRNFLDEPCCGLQIDIVPNDEAWTNHYTDPAALSLAANVVSELHRNLYTASSPKRER
ncbi:MAG: hypothetical protein KDB27_10970 [Planctomycetales bacterium]|nr:hypothetical protein [Planctomycetales bacterium]